MAEPSWYHVDCARKTLGDEAFDLLAGCGYLTAHMDGGELYVDGRRVESAERVLKSMAEREDADLDEEDKAVLDPVPQRFNERLTPFAVGDKVTLRERLTTPDGQPFGKPGDRAVILSEGEYGQWVIWRNNLRMSVPGYKLRKGYSNQADAEFAADNVLYEGVEYEEGKEDEEEILPEVSDDEAEVDDTEEVEDDDDGGELVEAEADDPEDEGEGMVEIDPETGEPVKYLSEEMEKDETPR
jgi:hypothetical protein